MTKRVFVIGAGAVGAYTGGHMARAGVDVTMVDPWVEHVEAMRTTGLELRGLSDEECCNVKVKAMTPEEFQAVVATQPVDIGIISTKSYDTEWAAGRDELCDALRVAASATRLCYAMRCDAMLCDAMLCYACHAIPCHAMPCHAMLCRRRSLGIRLSSHLDPMSTLDLTAHPIVHTHAETRPVHPYTHRA